MRALQLDLSSNAGLKLFPFVIHRRLDEYADFIPDLLPHSDRWAEFYFRTGRYLTDHLIAIRHISGLTYHLHLPRLTQMTVRFPQLNCFDIGGECLCESRQEGPVSERYLFFRTWYMPQLKILRTKNIVSITVDGRALEALEIFGLEDLGDFEWSNLTRLVIRSETLKLKDQPASATHCLYQT